MFLFILLVHIIITFFFFFFFIIFGGPVYTHTCSCFDLSDQSCTIYYSFTVILLHMLLYIGGFVVFSFPPAVNYFIFRFIYHIFICTQKFTMRE